MSRNVLEIALINKGLKDEFEDSIKEMLTAHQYSLRNINNESFWAMGNAEEEILSCISYKFTDNSLILEGWMYDASINQEFDLSFSYLRKLPARNIRNLIEDIASMVTFKTCIEI